MNFIKERSMNWRIFGALCMEGVNICILKLAVAWSDSCTKSERKHEVSLLSYHTLRKTTCKRRSVLLQILVCLTNHFSRMSDLNFLFSSELRKCSFQRTRPVQSFVQKLKTCVRSPESKQNEWFWHFQPSTDNKGQLSHSPFAVHFFQYSNRFSLNLSSVKA
jgi:hypothetical protein